MDNYDSKIHFGIKLRKSKYSYNLVKDEFALINTHPTLPHFVSLIKEKAYTENNMEYTVEWCRKYREICLENYDYNMRYFSSLDIVEFNNELDKYLKKYKKFNEIFDLHECDKLEGYYIMVIEKYKQVYIGKSNDIKKRIQQHWRTYKSFDRTLFPMYNKKSVFSVDFFRALDTSRIFIWKKKLMVGMESGLVENFPRKFLCNRIGGDITDATGALATMNNRTES